MEPDGLEPPLWRPRAETLDAIAGVQRARWRAARPRTPQLLWTTPSSWLRSRRDGNAAHHLTRGGRLIK
jgi:hypothetical protein